MVERVAGCPSRNLATVQLVVLAIPKRLESEQDGIDISSRHAMTAISSVKASMSFVLKQSKQVEGLEVLSVR